MYDSDSHQSNKYESESIGEKLRNKYRDISIQEDLLEKIKLYAEKEFHSLLGKSRTSPYSNKPETTQHLLMKDIEFINICLMK